MADQSLGVWTYGCWVHNGLLLQAMAHPLIPKIEAIATPLATALDLDVVHLVFQTNQSPPVLRLDVRHRSRDTSLEDCEQMSRALEAALDEVVNLPDANLPDANLPDANLSDVSPSDVALLQSYVLEVSSPGVSNILTADRDFISFKGFPVLVQTTEPHRGQNRWEGSLVRRDPEFLYLTQKGRPIKIPRSLIGQVQLLDGAES